MLGSYMPSPSQFLLDGNVYNLLEVEPLVCTLIGKLTERRVLAVVASPVLVLELKNSPYGGIPNWFPVKVEPEGIAIGGLARAGMARSSKGVMFRNHRGASQKGFDAIIAHSAHAMRAVLVSEDRRCRERLTQLAGAQSAITYQEFKTWLEAAIQPTA